MRKNLLNSRTDFPTARSSFLSLSSLQCEANGRGGVNLADRPFSLSLLVNYSFISPNKWIITLSLSDTNHSKKFSSRENIMLFQTSTPKKRTLIPLPRSSTPNQTSKKNVKDHQLICCSSSHQIKLDSLLYRPKTEFHPSSNIRQIWAI